MNKSSFKRGLTDDPEEGFGWNRVVLTEINRIIIIIIIIIISIIIINKNASLIVIMINLIYCVFM